MSLSIKRPGRPTIRSEAKQRLTVSVTPTTRRLLGKWADLAQTSIAEVIEEWVTGMASLDMPMRPLGRGSLREKQVTARGKAINASGECKVQLNLKLTPATKERLIALANKACDEHDKVKPSVSDILDRWMTSSAELLDLFDDKQFNG
jgi:hypothetical protein